MAEAACSVKSRDGGKKKKERFSGEEKEQKEKTWSEWSDGHVASSYLGFLILFQNSNSYPKLFKLSLLAPYSNFISIWYLKVYIFTLKFLQNFKLTPHFFDHLTLLKPRFSQY